LGIIEFQELKVRELNDVIQGIVSKFPTVAEVKLFQVLKSHDVLQVAQDSDNFYGTATFLIASETIRKS